MYYLISAVTFLLFRYLDGLINVIYSLNCVDMYIHKQMPSGYNV